jgi:uncharacterized protein YkwD
MIGLPLLGILALAGCVQSSSAREPALPRPVRTVPPPVPGGPNAAIEQQIFELVNRHRVVRGLAPLVPDRRIGEEARRHSVAMARGATPVGHRGFDDRIGVLRAVLPIRRSAENVGVNHGYPDPAAQVVRGWLESREHRVNIEGPYELTGVGVATNAKDEVFFTQIFVGR